MPVLPARTVPLLVRIERIERGDRSESVRGILTISYRPALSLRATKLFGRVTTVTSCVSRSILSTASTTTTRAIQQSVASLKPFPDRKVYQRPREAFAIKFRRPGRETEERVLTTSTTFPAKFRGPTESDLGWEPVPTVPRILQETDVADLLRANCGLKSSHRDDRAAGLQRRVVVAPQTNIDRHLWIW